MKFFLTLALSAFLISSATYADDNLVSDETKQTNMSVEPTQSKNSFSFLELSTVVAPGEAVSNGDLVLVNRKFDAWNLRCDVRLSANKHACFVEQTAFYENVGVQLRIGNNKDGRTVAIAKLPSSFDAGKGLRLKFSGLEKTIENESFACAADHCIGGFFLEGFIQEAILGSRYLSFIIPVQNDPQEFEIALAMSGFDEAISAAKDPFGRELSMAANEKKAKEKTAATTKAVAEPVKPAPKPVASKTAQPKAASVSKKSEPKVAGTKSTTKSDGLF